MPFGKTYATGLFQIDIDAWEALEEAGCVFLPGSGWRNFKDGEVNFAQESICSGLYTTSTAVAAGRYYHTWLFPNFNPANTQTSGSHIGTLVRLVQDY